MPSLDLLLTYPGYTLSLFLYRGAIVARLMYYDTVEVTGWGYTPEDALDALRDEVLILEPWTI